MFCDTEYKYFITENLKLKCLDIIFNVLKNFAPNQFSFAKLRRFLKTIDNKLIITA